MMMRWTCVQSRDVVRLDEEFGGDSSLDFFVGVTKVDDTEELNATNWDNVFLMNETSCWRISSFSMISELVRRSAELATLMIDCCLYIFLKVAIKV